MFIRLTAVIATLVYSQLAAGQQLSSQCSTFLQALDNDASLHTCTSKLLEATADFNPQQQSSATGHSLDSLKSTLVSICQSTIQFCDTAVIGQTLNAFSGNCSVELSGATAIPSVISLYDAIYIVKPLKDAMCTTNPTSGNSCLLEIAGAPENTPSSANSNATIQSVPAQASIAPQNATMRTYRLAAAVPFNLLEFASDAMDPAYLYVQASNLVQSLRLRKRQQPSATAAPSSTRSAASSRPPSPSSSTADNGTTTLEPDAQDIVSGVITANATTFQKTYLPFLFLNPAMSNAQLCTPCTKQVMASYISFESSQPYALGLSNSYLLGTQASFWKALGNKCGDGYLADVNTIAGQNQLLESSARSLEITSALLVSISLIGLHFL